MKTVLNVCISFKSLHQICRVIPPNLIIYDNNMFKKSFKPTLQNKQHTEPSQQPNLFEKSLKW